MCILAIRIFSIFWFFFYNRKMDLYKSYKFDMLRSCNITAVEWHSYTIDIYLKKKIKKIYMWLWCTARIMLLLNLQIPTRHVYSRFENRINPQCSRELFFSFLTFAVGFHVLLLQQYRPSNSKCYSTFTWRPAISPSANITVWKKKCLYIYEKYFGKSRRL